MEMTQRMATGLRCTGRTEGIPRISCCSTRSEPALHSTRISFVKWLGSPAVPMMGLHLQEQRKRGFLRSGRQATNKDGMIVVSEGRVKVDCSTLTPYSDSWLELKGIEAMLDSSTLLYSASWLADKAINAEEDSSAWAANSDSSLEGKAIEAMVDSSASTPYSDSWLEVKAIEFITDRLASLSGKATDLKGYDGFVDMTRKFVNGLPSKQQRKMVIEMLHIVLPQWLLSFVRMLPKTTFAKESYAMFTMIFFKWLIGESEVRDGEIDGVTMKSTVYIKKCRYLEQSQCVGLCVNLCKNPTEKFILEQFGMPLTMKPNFEDMSCEMIYGLHPPPLEEDPAYQQPCFSLCQTAKRRPNCI